MFNQTIGIMTYHNDYNYGTMLQAIALLRAIQKLGYSPELIDYFEPSRSTGELMSLRLKRMWIYILHFRQYYIRYMNRANVAHRKQQFRDFYGRYALVGNTKYKGYEELLNNPPKYGLYIVGSDQTWNPFISGAMDAFLLNFVPEGRAKGSYAPSMGVSQLDKNAEEMFIHSLSSFKYLSCREKTSQVFLEGLLDRPVSNVLDPTLLLDENEWKSLESCIPTPQPYILQYFLGDRREHRKFVQRLSERTGLKVVSLPFNSIDMAVPGTEKLFVGPESFLYLVRNARYVCTDSFHGTAFSINFNKSFFAFCKCDNTSSTSDNLRLYDLLDAFSLRDRLFESEFLPEKLDIDFEYANKAIETHRIESFKYLRDMLQAELGGGENVTGNA